MSRESIVRIQWVSTTWGWEPIQLHTKEVGTQRQTPWDILLNGLQQFEYLDIRTLIINIICLLTASKSSRVHKTVIEYKK